MDWNDVQVSLPEEDGRCLCVVEHGHLGKKIKDIRIAYRRSSCGGAYWEVPDGEIITHWVDLPNLPED